MKSFLGILLALLGLQLARAEVVLQGVMKNADTLLFSLTDTQAKTSRWVPLGGGFGGYTLERFDSGPGVLTLKKDHAELRLSLPDARTRKAENPVREVVDMTDAELDELGFRRLKAGDTVAKIARDKHMPIAALMALNPGLSPARLKVGQIMVVGEPKEPNPPPEPAPPSRGGTP